VLEHAGDIYSALKKPEKAIACWESSLAASEKAKPGEETEEGLKDRVEEKIKNLKKKMESR
jgi:hypothetical protein